MIYLLLFPCLLLAIALAVALYASATIARPMHERMDRDSILAAARTGSQLRGDKPRDDFRSVVDFS
jgi:hypothetical protein